MRPGLSTTVAALVLIAGCSGGADVDPAANSRADTERLLDRASAGTAALRSVHMVADLRDDRTPVVVDVRVDLRTEDFTGTIDLRGTPVELTRIGADLYVRTNARFLARTTGIGARIARSAAGKYLKGPAGDPRFEAFEGFLRLADPRPALDDARGRVTRGPVESYRGEPVVPLSGPAEDRASTSTLYLAEQGVPRVVRMVNDDAANGASVAYDRFDEPVDVRPPPGDEVVELSPSKG